MYRGNKYIILNIQLYMERQPQNEKPLTLKILQNLSKVLVASADSAQMLIDDSGMNEQEAVENELKIFINRMKMSMGQFNFQRMMP